MGGMRMALMAALCGGAGLALAACDNGPSAVVQRQAAGTQMAANAESRPDVSSRRGGEADAVDHRQDPVRLVDGAPLWSASKRYSAEENARRAFERNGQAFGAATLDGFVKKAHAFVDHPPAGTLTLTRANGDKLLYDPRGNVFAVASSAGAPRTMFKPDDGKAYWEKVKAQEAERQTARSSRRRNAPDDA